MVVFCILSTKALSFTADPALSSRKSFARHVTNLHHPASFLWRLQLSADEAESSEKYDSAAFKSRLRDLENSGVRLLTCDAKEVNTLSAALWSTMAEVSADDGAQSVCIVLESIPVGALEAFAEDFTVLKTQMRLMEHLPELARFSISIVAKGPAFLIETGARTEDEIKVKNERILAEKNLDETRITNALKSFVDRIVIGEAACPYTKSHDLAAVGLEKRGIVPGPVAYRYNGSSDVCGALAAFWECICELIKTEDKDLSTTVLSLPAIGAGTSVEAHQRFAAVVEVVSRYLCLFRGDDLFGLVHFHPAYERNLVEPVDLPAYGHLPPQSWLRAMLTMNGNVEEAENLTEEEISKANYQRRSPHTAINILRVSHLNAAVGAKSIVDLDLGDGRTEKASGISTYSRNAIKLANIPTNTLDTALQQEIAMQLEDQPPQQDSEPSQDLLF